MKKGSKLLARDKSVFDHPSHNPTLTQEHSASFPLSLGRLPYLTGANVARCAFFLSPVGRLASALLLIGRAAHPDDQGKSQVEAELEKKWQSS